MLTFSIVDVSLHLHDLAWYRNIDSAALHELSLTQPSAQALSQHFWMDVSRSKSNNEYRGPNDI